jgi:hypothetical protein
MWAKTGKTAERDRMSMEVNMSIERTDHYGRVVNGVVVLEDRDALPEGTYVRVTPVQAESTLGQRLLEFAGTVKGLPPDMARNHDYYIHGTSKK